MQVTDSRKFRKNLKDIPNSDQISILDAIETIEKATKFTDIPNLTPIKGHKNYYRIRVGDWRIGLYWENSLFTLVDVGKRGDIYKRFP